MVKPQNMNKLFAGILFLIASNSSLDVTAASKEIAQNKSANTQTDAEYLSKILADTMTFEAGFEQKVYRENSDQPETTIGRFLIQRPNHFRWETAQPFEQAIIADGRALWTYDPELEQVTIQDQQSVLADSPLLLLTSSVEKLVESFDIQQMESDNNPQRQLFALIPKETGLFESVHLLIKDKKITEFFLLDTLGGRTSVVFSNIKLNQPLELSEFIFSPPEGIDVIDSRAIISE
jgi:outer membrane lipoprotein carrier protein